ncbi:MAG TPA: 50S ribosomal protein L18 [Candidatus Aenigmarchaeota archaeon]|nr:50S ribosomal protein L18 [Candidatus Aenigmarchaeota archaeon]
MKLSPTYKMPLKRRRLGKTDYKKRLKLLLSKKPRLVVRKSLRYITAQIIEFDPKGDRTLVSVTSKELRKLGWKFACDNTPAAYLTGLLIGKRASEKGIEEAILDMGLYRSTKGSRIYAVVKGARDAGLNVPVDENIFPSEDRIKGLHIANYLKKFKDIPEEFEKIKKKIMGEKNA